MLCGWKCDTNSRAREFMTQKSTNIKWHASSLSAEERETKLGVGAIVWFTGLSGSGKSTVARAVETALVQNGHAAFVLDGDNLRFGLNKDLGFSAEDRQENIRRVGEVSKLLPMPTSYCSLLSSVPISEIEMPFERLCRPVDLLRFT